MKCKVCGGTGISNTCVNGTFKPCTFCDGTGEYEPFDLDIELDKLYPTKQTNEEWFTALSTEEKAEFLIKVSGYEGFCVVCNQHCNNDTGNQCSVDDDDMKMWVEWLKQPHIEKEVHNA